MFVAVVSLCEQHESSCPPPLFIAAWKCENKVMTCLHKLPARLHTEQEIPADPWNLCRTFFFCCFYCFIFHCFLPVCLRVRAPPTMSMNDEHFKEKFHQVGKLNSPENRFDAPSSQPRNCKNLNLKFSCYFCVFFTGLKIWEFSLRQLFTLSRFPFFLSCWSKFFEKTSGNSSSILLLCVCVLSFLKHFHTLTERTFHRGDFARANFHDDGGKMCDGY